MTQAFNLSQLANNLNSSGQLDASDGLVNSVPVANGGTGASTADAARSNLVVPKTDGTGASGTWPINISGNAATASSASAWSSTNWTIEQSGQNIVFKYNGSVVFTITSSGSINSSGALSVNGGLSVTGAISATSTITSNA